ncbi:MAG: glycosyltransferase [Sphingomonadales bacterium]|nr:glycosyltransferase [Sphingomonadales bacterium]
MADASIALATYNGERYLPRQLESLAWQTRLPAELVVTDDRSTDRTVAILHDFARTAPFPVRVIVNERNLNYRANFLKAAGLCTAEIILFCDQDDVWRPAKVATMTAQFDADPALSLAYHNATVVDADEQALATMFDAAEQREILARPLPPPWHFARGLVQAFRRDLLAFDDLWPVACEHFDSGRLGHDRWYFFLALALGKVGFVDEDLLMYRQHGANAYGADRRMGLVDRLRARLRHHPESDELGAAGARSRAAVLTALLARAPAASHPRIARLAAAYTVHAERLARRARTFAAPSPACRAASLLRSLRQGDYCGNPWGFDPRSVLRDAIAGVAGLGD